LKSGTPVAIEQDLAWYVDKATGKGEIVVAHSDQATGAEPTLRAHFFERVRPMIEAALKRNDRAKWPLIVVHFDFKGKEVALFEAVWKLLGDYEPWITTAKRGSDSSVLAAFDAKPLLVLTEESDAQEKVFFDQVPVGAKLRLFGSAHTIKIDASTREERARLAVTTPPEKLLAERPTNYRRWWNNPWAIVEEGGQTRAGDWTAADNKRLRALVDHAHKQGFWIRFYTLDGFVPAESRGWDKNYNFGSRDAVEARWKAAIDAGVDLIAADQYEDFAAFLKKSR
ncbi:MAG: hypothetical protein ABI823_12585, partial [Bryobacteraceae bacterium]